MNSGIEEEKKEEEEEEERRVVMKCYGDGTYNTSGRFLGL